LSDDDADKQALFAQAGEKYQQATEINENYHEAYNNWGLTLADHTMTMGEDDTLKQALIDQASEKYQQADEIKKRLHQK